MSEDLTQNLPDNHLKLILSRLDSIDARLDSMNTRLNVIDTRLTALEDKVERRLLETRPIWESVLEQLKEVNVRLTRVENESIDLRRFFRAGFIDLIRVQGNFDERLEKLERP